jgi:enediyne biosynthesis protein E5
VTASHAVESRTSAPPAPSEPVRRAPLWQRIKPQYYSATLITLILVVGEYQAGIIGGYHRMALALGAACLTEIVLGKLLRGRIPNLASAYISGNSVAILSKPLSIALWPFWLGGFIAIASKYVLALRGRHLWNPTNFSIAFVLVAAPNTFAALSHQWSNSWVATGVIYLVGTIVCLRAKVLHLTVTYLVAYCAIAYLRVGFDRQAFDIEISPLTGAMYTLFVFFMVTDPRTMIAGRMPQIVVCALVALVDNAIRYAGTNDVAWIAPLLPAPPIFALFIVGPIALAISILLGREERRT